MTIWAATTAASTVATIHMHEDAHLEEQYELLTHLPDDMEDAYDEEEDDLDPDVEFRRRILNDVMERHPDISMTREEYEDYLYDG